MELSCCSYTTFLHLNALPGMTQISNVRRASKPQKQSCNPSFKKKKQKTSPKKQKYELSKTRKRTLKTSSKKQKKKQKESMFFGSANPEYKSGLHA